MNIVAALLCVFLFSLTAPLTRLAALETTPEMIILMRLLGAALVCLIFMVKDRILPPKNIWPGLVATAFGSVIGFNSLMAYGLKEVPSGHAAVALASLPMATSIYSSLRDRINPGFGFWFFALAGTALSFGFFFSMNVTHITRGDLLLVLAVFSAAFGYVEGGRVSRSFGGSRTMCWAILIVLPFALPVAIFYFQNNPSVLSAIDLKTWLSLSYLALISQSLGMFLWFRVLAKGPMEKIALVQLLQPFMTLAASIILLNENVILLTWVIAGLVALCVMGSYRKKHPKIANF